jgi:hypothetical protein
MPVPRRRGIRRKTHHPPWDQLSKWDQFSIESFHDPDESRAYFDTYGTTMLCDWIAENPGTRPTWWWHLYGPQEPVKVLGQVEPEPERGPSERRESQAAYLARHDLLTVGEQELWAAGSLPAEEVTYPRMMAFTGLP